MFSILDPLQLFRSGRVCSNVVWAGNDWVGTLGTVYKPSAGGALSW